MWAHIQLFIQKNPIAILFRAALSEFISKSALELEMALIEVQDLALGFAELHEVHTGQVLKFVQVPLDVILSFY